MLFGARDRVFKRGEPSGDDVLGQRRIRRVDLPLNRRAGLFIDLGAHLRRSARQAVDGFTKYAAQVRHGSQSLTCLDFLVSRRSDSNPETDREQVLCRPAPARSTEASPALAPILLCA